LALISTNYDKRDEIEGGDVYAKNVLVTSDYSNRQYMFKNLLIKQKEERN
jgi:hypothetical protein